jgi:flagellar hook-length control protein FliK
MNTTTNKDENAGVTEQILPGSRPLPVPPLPKIAAALPRTHAGDESSAEDFPAAGAKSAPSPVRADLSRHDSAPVGPLTPMARISEIISREVQMFKRAGDDLVEVVLTPDAKTQISLRLRWRDGQMEAQARCDLGDYRALNLQWPQLQAKLAEHGVRLAHLSERVQTGYTDYFKNLNFARPHGGDRRSSDETNDSGHPAVPSAEKSRRSVSFRNGGHRKRLEFRG